jgi:steroid delta-isomerase-like uncharacterized protein
MTCDEIVALLDHLNAALCAQDVETLVELHAEGCHLESPVAGNASGRAAIREVYRGWFAAFPDVAFAFEQPVVDGRRAAQLATMTGTHVGGFLGLPPSGRRFQVPVVFLYTFADGRVIDERRVYDFTGMLMQVGVLKAKPA